MSTWVQKVIDLIRAGDFNGAMAEVQSAPSIEDLDALELALQGANWTGRLSVVGIVAAIAVRRTALQALQANAAKSSSGPSLKP